MKFRIKGRDSFWLALAFLPLSIYLAVNLQNIVERSNKQTFKTS